MLQFLVSTSVLRVRTCTLTEGKVWKKTKYSLTE